MIRLSVITFSGFHCSLMYRAFKEVKFAQTNFLGFSLLFIWDKQFCLLLLPQTYDLWSTGKTSEATSLTIRWDVVWFWFKNDRRYLRLWSKSFNKAWAWGEIVAKRLSKLVTNTYYLHIFILLLLCNSWKFLQKQKHVFI
jgi:hypothetical protein